MGFGSFFKGLGKGLLKAAPFAASFIPGVGPLASALIGGGAGAASGAMGGGGWKGALGGGLGGASTGMMMEGLQGLGKGSFGKGLAPSSAEPFMGPRQPGMMSKIGGFLNKNKGALALGGGLGIGLSQLGRSGQGGGDVQRYPDEQEYMAPRGQNMRVPNLSNPFEQGANEYRKSRGLGPRVPTMY